MFENEPKLKQTTDRIVAEMLAAKLAQKKSYTDHRLGKDYWLLITPDAFDKELITIAVLGYPEQVGVWSFTLLGQSRIDETSMEPYFREFANQNLGHLLTVS